MAGNVGEWVWPTDSTLPSGNAYSFGGGFGDTGVSYKSKITYGKGQFAGTVGFRIVRNAEISGTTIFQEDFGVAPANYDLNDGYNGWEFYVDEASSADAEGYIKYHGASGSKAAHVYVTDDGDETWHIHLRKVGVNLIQGKRYAIKFKAKTEIGFSRKINVMLEEDEGSWTNYSQAPYFTITDTLQDYYYDFVMKNPSDNGAVFVIDMGECDLSVETPLDVIVDDIKVIEESQNDWKIGVWYIFGSEVIYENKRWKCVYAHTSQVDWYPGAPGLWFWELQP
jgi:hypothetical protein